MYRNAARLLIRSAGGGSRGRAARPFSTSDLAAEPVEDSAFVEAWKKVSPNIDPPKTHLSFMKPRPPTPASIPSKLTVNFVLPYQSEISSKEQIHQKNQSKDTIDGDESEDMGDPLTAEEQEEKEQLLEEGFSMWTRRDFNTFIRACEKYGRNDIKSIVSEIEGKTEEEVERYAKVFKERYKELSEYDRIIKNIERGEARISRKDEIMKAIGKKLDRYKNPWLELKIQYGQNKGKLYNEECDRFMVLLHDVHHCHRYDKFCLFYMSVWMMRNIIHFNTLANQPAEVTPDAAKQHIESEMAQFFYALQGILFSKWGLPRSMDNCSSLTGKCWCVECAYRKSRHVVP